MRVSRLVASTFAVLALVLTISVAPAATSAPIPAAAAATCQDYPTTAGNWTLSYVYVEIRASASCSGTYWMRMTHNGGNIGVAYDMVLQTKTWSGGTITESASYGSTFMMGGGPNQILSSYTSNRGSARLKWRQQGYQWNYTGWVSINQPRAGASLVG